MGNIERWHVQGSGGGVRWAFDSEDGARAFATQWPNSGMTVDGPFVPASQLEGAVAAIATLREYIGNIEGEGPIHYTEALELCDSFLPDRGGQ